MATTDFNNVVKFKQSFEAVLLGVDDIGDFLKLQKKVWRSLAPDEKHFLKLRTRRDLLAHWEAEMPMIGVREKMENPDEKGPLVAQGLLAYPTNGHAVKNLEGYPIAEAATTAIVQSLCADPDIKGQGLSGLVLDAAKMLAEMEGHNQLIAKVAADNKGSSKSFLNSAFTRASTGEDPVKKYPVVYWRYPVRDAAAAPEKVALTA